MLQALQDSARHLTITAGLTGVPYLGIARLLFYVGHVCAVASQISVSHAITCW
jgi:hypothetical protein